MKRLEQERAAQPPDKSSPQFEDDVRRRAYEIYEARGRTDGSEMEDWLQAETDVLEKKTLSKAA